ncbi:MAG: cupredoxin domain-containing protein [Gemmatimonadota bacterium]
MNRLLIIAALVVSSQVASTQAVTVKLSEWKIELSRDTVRAGPVTFRVTNDGAVNHAFHVRGAGVDKGTRDVPGRQSATLTVTVKAGTYEVFCPMSDESHKIAGMARTLVVIPSDSTASPKKPRN